MKKIIFTILMTLVCQNCSANPAIYVSNLNDAIHLSETINTEILLIFTSPTCIHCNNLKNDINNDINMVSNKIICYVDVVKQKGLAEKYGVKSIPDSRIIDKGKEKSRLVGYKNKETYMNFIKTN
jgi:thioredoxin-related protein